MTLRDEHLKKALQHAPDRNVVPNEWVREKVFSHVQKEVSQKPRRYWLAGLFSGIKHWQLTGLGGVAVAVLAVLMLRQQFPEDTVWQATVPTEVAQNKADVPEQATRSQSDVERAEAKHQTAKAKTQAETEMELSKQDAKQIAQPEAVEQALPEATPSATAPKVVAPTVAPPKVAVQEMADAPVAQSLPEVNQASSEANDQLEAAPAAAPRAPVARKKEAESTTATRKLSLPEDAKALGAHKANSDIQAGELRILHFVDDWPANKPMLDEATGYRVELRERYELTTEELEAYNHTMREWHLKQK